MKHFLLEQITTQDLHALGEKQEFCLEVVLNRKRKLLDFKAGLAKDL